MEENSRPNFARLDLGCGKWRKSGFIGWDNLEASDFQGLTEEDKEWIIPFDLNKGIPYPSDCIEEIYCSHFLEHTKDPIEFLLEVLRVCKNGAKVEIYVPLHEMLSVGHVTEFTETWFEENLPSKPFEKPDFSKLPPGNHHISLGSFFKIVFKEINRDKPAELRLADGSSTKRVFDEVHIILEVVK